MEDNKKKVASAFERKKKISTVKTKSSVSKKMVKADDDVLSEQQNKNDVQKTKKVSVLERKGFKEAFVDNLKTVFLAVLLALVIRSLFLEPFRIPSGSMYPTLRVGDYLFVTKYTYGYSRYSFPLGLPFFKGRIWYSEPQRGDVVVFRFPQNPHTDFIKRIVGMPGDRVQVKKGRLYINEKLIEREDDGRYVVDEYVSIPEFYHQYKETLPEGKEHPIIEISDDERVVDNTEEFVVPEDSFFMMGDNRDRSDDSRIRVGFVDKEYLVGKAKFIFFSHNDKGSLFKPWTWFRAIRWNRFFKGID